MPTYVSLINWTDQGVRNAKQTVNRPVPRSSPRSTGEASSGSTGPSEPTISSRSSKLPTTRALPPCSWSSARWATLGRLRSAPTTASRCRASLGGLADLCLLGVYAGNGLEAGASKQPQPFLYPGVGSWPLSRTISSPHLSGRVTSHGAALCYWRSSKPGVRQL